MTLSPASFTLHPDRLFPADTGLATSRASSTPRSPKLPIVSPHGHTDPQWFADNEPFPDPAQLFIVPDHYVHRMLYSQGVPPEDVGVPRLDGGPVEADPRKIWRRFAENFHLFRGTPSWLWLNHAFTEVLGFRERLSAANADRAYDHIAACLRTAGVPSARVVRAVQHRGADDNGEPARRSAVIIARSGKRLARAGAHRLPSRSRRRPRLSTFPREPRRNSGACADCDVSTYQAISPRSQSGAPISSRSVAPRQIMATRPHAPRTCPQAKRPRSMLASAPAPRRPPTRNCSARRC